jgi:hypothetical protein
MGQIEVYELLKNERLTGNETYFSPCDVKKLLRANGFSNGCLDGAWKDLIKLADSGYLEFKMSGKWSDWKRIYRLSEKKLKEEKAKNGRFQ